MVSHHWAPFEPDNRSPWTLRRVVHLHRRAAFAATWEELQRDLRDGPIVSVGRLLAGTACTARADFASTAQLLADAAVAGQEINRLKGWWFYRMLFGADPLTERLTLFWHNHFATANSKVEDAALMYRQNDTLRRHARRTSPTCWAPLFVSRLCSSTLTPRPTARGIRMRIWPAN